MRRTVWLGAWMVGAACSEPASPGAEPAGAAAAPSEPAATPAAEPSAPLPLPRPTDPAAFVGQHVLVPDGATLHLGPEPGAATVVLRLPPATGERAPTPAAAMRVVAHEGGRLKVQPAAPELACVPAVPGLTSFDVAVWVEPMALARVLGRAAEARFADGTSVRLRPGVLVGPPGERVEVSAHGLRLAVPLAEGDVSTLYAAEPIPVVPTGLRRLASGAPLTYAGGDPVLPESALMGGGLVLAQRTDGARTLARVASGCAEVEAVVDPVRLAAKAPAAGEAGAVAQGAEATPPATVKTGRYEIRGPSGEPVLARGGPTWVVEPGKPITWPSGTAAGTTAAKHTFDVAPTTHGDRLCFTVAPSEAAVAEAERLPLCLAATDVTRHEDPLHLAASAGILGMMASESEAFLASPYGSAEIDEDLGSAMLGATIGDAHERGGLGIVGTGRGGGGTGEGTIALGSLSTGGTGSVRGAVKAGEVTATGLDEAAAGKVITGGRTKLRYCYEKELARDGTLAGTLALSLEVDGGVVTKATATSDTLPAELLRCVERSAKRWGFSGAGTLAVPVTFALGE